MPTSSMLTSARVNNRSSIPSAIATRRNFVVRSVTRETPPPTIDTGSWMSSTRKRLETQRQEALKDNVNSLVSIAQSDVEYLQVCWSELTKAFSGLRGKGHRQDGTASE